MNIKGILTIVERVLKERVTVTTCNAMTLPNSHHYLLQRMKTLVALKMLECPQDV
jgi:hypothetical protein